MSRKEGAKDFAIIFATVMLIIFSFVANNLQTGEEAQHLTGNFVRPLKQNTDNISVTAHFCPEDRCYETIMHELENESNITCFFYEANLESFINKIEHNGELYLDCRNNISGSHLIHLKKGLMHMKFCVFNNTLITGSFNPTIRGNYYDNNNIVIIKSKALSSVYKDEIKKNFSDKSLGVVRIKSDHTEIINCFPQLADCESLIIQEINSANKSIYFMTFSFTDRKIAYFLKKRSDDGINVKGVVEEKFYNIVPNSIKNLTMIDKNRYNMHNKVFIIDNKTVITGSYNPSYNAKYNNWENLIVIKNRNIAKKFAQEFFKILNYNRTRADSCLKILFVIPNPQGRDAGKEEIVIKNNCNKSINLNYYFLESKNNVRRLRGIIQAKQQIIIRTSGLVNYHDWLCLENYTNILTNISWSNASEDEIIK